MGKASSNKKVARVARTGGGRTARGRGSLLWAGALTIAVVVGSFLVVFSRGQGQTSFDNIAPQRGDHWHVAYGFYFCDTFIAPITDQTDPLGIHTHGEGVIHVHPVAAAASGSKATLGVFMDAVDGNVSSSEIKVPGHRTLKNGMKCGQRKGRVEVRTWAAGASSDDRGKLVTGDPADLRLRDRQLLTIAFVPEGTEVPQPPTASQLDSLTDLGPTENVLASPATADPKDSSTTASPAPPTGGP